MAVCQGITSEGCEQIKQGVESKQDRHEMTWGDYGHEGKSKLRTRTIDEIDTDHIENILISQPHLSAKYVAAFLAILKERYREDQHLIDDDPKLIE